MKKNTKNKLNATGLHSRVVIKLRDNIILPDDETESDFIIKNDLLSAQKLLAHFPSFRIERLFTSVSRERIDELVDKARTSDATFAPPKFLNYLVVNCLPQFPARELVDLLRSCENIESAYLENGFAPPQQKTTAKDPLHIYQGYLNAAPQGINARYAWNLKGGDGEGNVNFIDIEQGWIADHEDIAVHTLPNTGINNYESKDHGAAVLGVIMMQHNGIGGKGIAPKVNSHFISQWRPDGNFNTADAIMAAIDQLRFGDIILLEAQARDPIHEKKLLPVEIQSACFDVIRLATALGITVIEPAGNGDASITCGNNLDLYRLHGKRIFNPADKEFRDSGAVIVAAASSNTPHVKMNYSNYGKRVNCYAWGENVTTAGSLPLSSGFAINTYTGSFSGTSSASAIIAGVAIAIQSIEEANYNKRLSPGEMRYLLSSDLFGTASANGLANDQIGVMPDLKKIIEHIRTGNKEAGIRQGQPKETSAKARAGKTKHSIVR